jgi:AcrR family transcriptional regulator
MEGLRRAAGRPPTVSVAQIAEAALAIGLEKATVRKVAERLGMSVPGLYHHVRTREQLVMLAAAHSFEAAPCPDPGSKSWAQWLVEYCRVVFDVLVNEPELFARIAAGTTDPIVHARRLERFLEIAGSLGLEVAEAYEVYQEAMSAVLGAAALSIGDRAAAGSGGGLFPHLNAAVAGAAGERLALVRKLIAQKGETAPDRFEAVRALAEDLARRRGG